jgi:hypothetical protein
MMCHSLVGVVADLGSDHNVANSRVISRFISYPSSIAKLRHQFSICFNKRSRMRLDSVCMQRPAGERADAYVLGGYSTQLQLSW